MMHLDLFSGIGGFALAVDEVFGESEHTFCEIDPFCNAVLKKHWPNATFYEDIKTLDGKRITADLITGGFPCQPFSSAGKRRGKEDDRHLWPEMLRVIREVRPRWVLGENVGGLLTWNGGMVLEEVFADLEAEGYEVRAFVVPACSVGAPHRRDRVWIVAHTDRRSDRGEPGQDVRTNSVRIPADSESVGDGRSAGEERRIQKRIVVASEQKGSPIRGEGKGRAGVSIPSDTTSDRWKRKGQTTTPQERHEKKSSESRELERRPEGSHSDATDTAGARLEGRGRSEQEIAEGAGRDRGTSRQWDEDWPEIAAELCTVDDGLPEGLVRPKGWRNAALKAAGNAIVPQVAVQILKAMKEASYPQKDVHEPADDETMKKTKVEHLSH